MKSYLFGGCWRGRYKLLGTILYGWTFVMFSWAPLLRPRLFWTFPDARWSFQSISCDGVFRVSTELDWDRVADGVSSVGRDRLSNCWARGDMSYCRDDSLLGVADSTLWISPRLACTKKLRTFGWEIVSKESLIGKIPYISCSKRWSWNCDGVSIRWCCPDWILSVVVFDVWIFFKWLRYLCRIWL